MKARVIHDRIHASVHFASVIIGAIAIGSLSGLGSWGLFEALDNATRLRLDHPWLLWLLPPVACVLGIVYHVAGGESSRGTSLVIERTLPPEIDRPEASTAESTSDSGTADVASRVAIPARMAPMIFGATYAAQLTGASVGREGAALQIGASLASFVMKPLRLAAGDRRLMLIAAMAGAFGGAFGVPIAGAVFALEVQQTGRLRYDALAPALAASFTADFVVEGLGRATPIREMAASVDWWVVVRLAVVGIAAGMTARLFIRSLHTVRSATTRLVTWAPLRPVLGGIATIALAALVGRDYLGLSLPLVDNAIAGVAADWWDPALKLVFTVVALGCGIPGGEVTPLFVIGATLGSVLAAPLGLPVALVAVAAFAAVFGAAANTPVTCSILAAELFGGASLAPAGIVCIVAYAVSPRRGIYQAQRHGDVKDLRATAVRPPHA